MKSLNVDMTVTASAILEAKQARFARLNAWTDTHVVMSLTLRMPAPLQHTPLAQGFFRHVKTQLQALYPHAFWHTEDSAAGMMSWMTLEHVDPLDLKEAMLFFEHHHPFGELIDCDVYTASGPIKRTTMDEPQRRCFLCNNPALHCQREERHSATKIKRYVSERLETAIDAFLLEATLTALLDEIHLHPKFGCVTPDISGSHKDMAYPHFTASIQALKPFFKRFIELPIEEAHPAQLKTIGLEAEAAMMEATGGINTHKGTIFLLGWLLPYLKDAMKQGKPLYEAFSNIQKAASKPLLEELKQAQVKPQTTGEVMFEKFGLLGARGEIIQGFKSLRSFTLTQYAKHQRLVALMSVCDDTTILKRHSLRTLKRVQQDCQALLGEWNMNTYEQLSSTYQEEGISPGGSADLYSVWTLLTLCEPWLVSLETCSPLTNTHPKH